MLLVASPLAETRPAADHQTGAGTSELRWVSVLFVDLVGFTGLSESRDAEDVRELLGRYFDSARTIINRYGGLIEKFIGDAVMAVWGVPVAREDDAERAVRAALELVDAVAAFGEVVGLSQLRARAGVVTGQVASLAKPGEGLVVGDRVNTASRVQSVAQPGAVLVDGVTRQVTSAAIAYEDAGEHSLKGKREPLRLWRAARVVAGVGGSGREQGLEAPFVGRDSDLRLLKDLFHAALERRSARLVAVSGPAGVGKTRLRWEFSKYTDGLAEQFLWHSGRCLAYGDGVAYWALAEMVRQRLGIAEDASAEDAIAKLRSGLDRWVPDPGDREFLLPRLGTLLGVAEPGLGREELFAGWRLFFERLAEQQPVVLVFEDLQWADEGLVDFIEHLLEWSSASSMFMLTLARPDLAARAAGWPAGRRGATLLQLEPLDEAAMSDLLDGLVDGLPAAARERIVTRAEGVPLYGIEMVRALNDRGVLADRGGRLVLEGELGELDVPASLSSLLTARLDSLGPDERGLVKAMSVFGGAFPRSAAAALGGVPGHQLDAILAALVHKQVLSIRADPLSPDRGQYAFAQGLLRTVAYEMLTRGERKPRHRAAAEHLRRMFPNDGEEVAEVIAAHYLDAYRAAGGDPEADELRTETIAALRRAAQRAAIVGAPETAERAYRTAISLAQEQDERAELTRAAGEMAIQAGRFEPAFELLNTASSAHQAAGEERVAAHIAGQIGVALVRLGRIEEAIERIVAALEILGADRLEPEVGALSAALGHACVVAGRYEQAAEALSTALWIAQALKLPAVLSAALTSQGILYLQTSRAEEARVVLDGAIMVATRHDLSAELTNAHHNEGNLQMQWDLPAAAEHFEFALALARRRGDRSGESRAAGNLMVVWLMMARWDEAEQLGAELLDGTDSRPTSEFLHYPLALVRALRGDVAGTQAALERLSGWQQSDDPEYRAIQMSVAIALELARGHDDWVLEQGMPLLRHAIGTLGASNEAVRNAWPDTLEAALKLGLPDAAQELLALLADLPPGHVPPYLHAQLARGRALTAAALGESGLVTAHLSEAVDGFRSLGYPYWLARSQTDLAAWYIDQSRPNEAAPHLGEAASALDSLGAVPALIRVQQLQTLQPAATLLK